ncbi:MAG: lactonase family protein, partial [Halothiobacillus sp.]
ASGVIYPNSVTVNPAGTFAYVTNFGGGVSAYSINASTGALTPAGSPVATGTNPTSVTVNPAGTFAYVANQNDGAGNGTVSAYSINASTGALTPVAGSPFAAGTYATSVTVNPAGTFVYVANGGDSNVSAYSLSATGALTAVTGSPFQAGTYPDSITVAQP